MKLDKIEIKDWHELKYHPLCLVFPPMKDDEYDSLVKSMKDVGYDDSESIIVTVDPENDQEYVILDGRNRHMAAQDASVEPNFLDYTGDDLINFVTAKNIARRELTAGQKAAIASKLATYSIGDNQFTKGTTLKEAAEMTGASVTSIKKLNKLKENNPELADRVETGEVSLNDAVNKSKEDTGAGAGADTGKKTKLPLNPALDLANRLYDKYHEQAITTKVMKEMIMEAINEAMKL